MFCFYGSSVLVIAIVINVQLIKHVQHVQV